MYILTLVFAVSLCMASTNTINTMHAENLLLAYNKNETLDMKSTDIFGYNYLLNEIGKLMFEKGISNNTALSREIYIQFGESNLTELLDILVDNYEIHFNNSSTNLDYKQKGKARRVYARISLISSSFAGNKDAFRFDYVKSKIMDPDIFDNNAKCNIYSNIIRRDYWKIIAQDENRFNECWDTALYLRRFKKENPDPDSYARLVLGIVDAVLYELYKNHCTPEQLEALLEKCPEEYCDWGLFNALRHKPTRENYEVYKKHIWRFSRTSSKKEIEKDIKEFNVASEKYENWRKDMEKSENAKEKEEKYKATLRADVKKLRSMPLTTEAEFEAYCNEIKRVQNYNTRYPSKGIFYLNDHISRISKEPHKNLKDEYFTTIETAEATDEYSFEFGLALTCANALTRVADENDYPRLFTFINTYAAPGKRLVIFNKKGAEVKRQAALTILTTGVITKKTAMYTYFNLHLDEVEDTRVKKAMQEGIKHFGIAE